MQQEETLLLQAMYEEYLIPLKKFAAKLGVKIEDIEDLVHETFIEYYMRYPLDLPDKVRTVMLIRILRSIKAFPFSLTLRADCESAPLSLSFSCQDASLPNGVTLTRNGGENLEGIFWGAFIEIPLSLLPPSDSYLCRLSYLRNQTESSPFPGGTALLKIK